MPSKIGCGWCLSAVFLVFLSTARAQNVEEYIVQARSLAESNRLAEAAETLEKGLRAYPDSPHLLLQLGSLLVRLGQAERGDRLLATALKMLPSNPEALKDRAQAQLRIGNLEFAVKLLRKSLWYQPTDAEAHFRLAFALFLQEKDGEALKEVRKAVEMNPFSSTYRRFSSLLLELDGEAEEALRQLRMAFRLDPTNPQTLYRLSRAERGRKNFGQAIEYADLASELDPENPLYIQELASLYAQIEDSERAKEAHAAAKRLEEAFDTYVEALRLSELGRQEQAIQVLRAAVEKQSSFPTGTLLLADLYRRKGDAGEALKYYGQVLETDSSKVYAREESAWIQAQSGSMESALELMENSGEPSSNQLLLEGYSHFLNQDWEEALEHFREVQQQYPLLPGLLKLISSCLNELGQDEQALATLDKASQLNPRDLQVTRQIHRIQLEKALEAQKKQDWELSIRLLKELVERDELEAGYVLHLGYSYQNIGQLEEAVSAYRKGLELDPQADWARVNLASSLYLLTLYDDSSNQWEQVLSRNPTPQAHFQLGLCYSQLNRTAEAEVAFERALRLGHETPELFYNLGIIRLRLLKTEDAWALIGQAARMGYKPARDLMRRARQR